MKHFIQQATGSNPTKIHRDWSLTWVSLLWLRVEKHTNCPAITRGEEKLSIRCAKEKAKSAEEFN